MALLVFLAVDTGCKPPFYLHSASGGSYLTGGKAELTKMRVTEDMSARRHEEYALLLAIRIRIEWVLAISIY